MKIELATLVKDGGFFDQSNWIVTLENNNVKVDVDFRTGPAYRKWKKKTFPPYSGYWSQYIQYGKEVGHNMPVLRRPEKIVNGRVARHQQMVLEEFQQLTVPIPPTVDDVVYCLASDATYIMFGQSFEEFCSDFGYYAEDSISAKKSFDGCRDSYLKMKKLGFSDEDIEKLSREEEI